jgi:ABC-type dipeptide/oligopeptide/nickel transport systems, permease components
MSFQPVILWTDALIWLLALACTAFAWHIVRTPVLRSSWHEVLVRPMGMSSAVVLAVFVLAGLADSLHYRAKLDNGQLDVEVRSVLDRMLAPLTARSERTYSAPLATHSQARETVEKPDGSTVRETPRLQFGGAHLADTENDWLGDVVSRSASGLGLGLLASLLFAVLLAAVLSRFWRCSFAAALVRLRQPQDRDPAWRSLLVTVSLLLLTAGAAAGLAGGYHVLGTDKVGQDVLYQTLKSIRTGLVIGTLTTLVTLPVAIGLGLLAGYFRGWADDAIQYVYTTLNSIPWVLLVAAAVLIVQVFIEQNESSFSSVAERADVRLLALCVIIGLTGWTGLARLLRAETLKLRELDYVTAARAFGVSGPRILLRHILPNVQHLILISVVMDFSGLVLAEAILSYVGVGVDPVMNSWGNMINAARLELAREPVVWWPLLAAFSFMFALVLSANLFADVVQDAFDPRTAARGGKS